MLKSMTTALCLLLFLIGCEEEKTPLLSGVDRMGFDTSIRPQDDFFNYVNGTWLKNTVIPADKSDYGSFTMLADKADEDLRTIIEGAAAEADRPAGSDAQKVGDFFLSFMDMEGIDARGLDAIRPELDRVDAIKSMADLPQTFAHLVTVSVRTPVALWVDQDAKNSTEYIVYLSQSGLGLPDRDYYFSEDFADIRSKYVRHIENILALAGQSAAGAKAKKIMAMETEMASHHWSRTKNRDRKSTYNKQTIDKLTELNPKLNWPVFFDETGIAGEAFIVRQPSYMKALGDVISHYQVADWKSYLTWQVLNSNSEFLPETFVDADFEFYSKTLRGQEANRPRWKRAVNTTSGVLGEIVGKIYVDKHFKPESKARMVQLVDNLREAFRQRVSTLAWMTPATREEALAKLSQFVTKIGYPDKWKDYSPLTIDQADLAGNMRRSRKFEFEYMVAKLGKPIDRTEWLLSPQTVNAYYNPQMNEIVFPAAILQPPFFDALADDALNYGAIGAVIGHELTHGFDDQGRYSDGSGNMREWWTKADELEFQKRAQLMVSQYADFSPMEGANVNGLLTLGENIADLGGLTIAYQAYRASLNGRESPVIDGFSGDQRFFIGWAQVWRRKYRDNELKRRLVIDPHSPSQYRVIGILSNMPEFYQVYGISETDQMYRKPEVRVAIW